MLTGRDLAAILARANATTTEDLIDYLYWQCYVKPFSEPVPESAVNEDLTPGLRAAHAGENCREFGWRVVQALDSGRILARKGVEVRTFDPGHYLNLDSPFDLPAKDGRVAICLPRDSITVQPGFYHIFGEAIPEENEGARLLRFYWNVAADGAPLLVRLVTRALGRFQIPYQMKLPQSRRVYWRRDSAVLYVNRRYYRILCAILTRVHDEIAPHLGPDTPLYTKRLAHGLALAENPGESFGKSRCRIVAQALWKAREQGATADAELFSGLLRGFQECGVDPQRPYLNPGSREEYEWP